MYNAIKCYSFREYYFLLVKKFKIWLFSLSNDRIKQKRTIHEGNRLMRGSFLLFKVGSCIFLSETETIPMAILDFLWFRFSTLYRCHHIKKRETSFRKGEFRKKNTTIV